MQKVIIADDSALIRLLLKRMLARRFSVIAAVEDGSAAVLAVQQLNPELILLDISMPIMNGFDAARQIKQLRPFVHILFVSEHREQSYVDTAFNVGGSGYVLKSRIAPELLPAMQDVLAGKEYGRASKLS